MGIMSSPDPALAPAPDPALAPAVRPVPRDLQRVLLGYLTSALAVACGLPVLLVGWFAASRCTGEGFRCLGWVVYAMLAAVLVAVVALPFLARRYRLGVWFALLTIAFVAAPLALGDGSLNAGTAFLGPGLAAWVSEPREPAPTPPLALAEEPPSAARHWVPRWVAVVVLVVVLPVLGRVI
jgi:hypothetical protein